ncbi:hypothetical protein GLOIN_2v1475986 [Rhizophagus clarus]|uniref:Uncharacterized protein n=1 Tax=Rhizophagus clarus TaxID=94130 RepID=A0A8H3LG94_9GLOM|nr:hypothetical protein GLOIN_2v1475986 [Rhizophagus clarus]
MFLETIFVYLFENEPTFQYSPVQRKYYCQFQGKAGEERLWQILNYDYWSYKQDSNTKTTGYVLFVNYEETTLSELNENNQTFQCGTATCTFVSDSREFVDENKSEINKSLNTNHSNIQNYRFILPCTSL